MCSARVNEEAKGKEKKRSGPGSGCGVLHLRVIKGTQNKRELRDIRSQCMNGRKAEESRRGGGEEGAGLATGSSWRRKMGIKRT